MNSQFKSAEEWVAYHNRADLPGEGSYVRNLLIEHTRQIQSNTMREAARIAYKRADEASQHFEKDRRAAFCAVGYQLEQATLTIEKGEYKPI